MKIIFILMMIFCLVGFGFSDPKVRSIATEFFGVWKLNVYSDAYEFSTTVNLTMDNTGQLKTTFENVHLSEKYAAYLELESTNSGEVLISNVINSDDEDKELPTPHNLFQIQFDNKSGVMVSHGNFKDLPHLLESGNKGDNKVYQFVYYPPNNFVMTVFDRTSSSMITVVGQRQEIVKELPFWSRFSSPMFFVIVFMATRLLMSRMAPQPQQPQPTRPPNRQPQQPQPKQPKQTQTKDEKKITTK